MWVAPAGGRNTRSSHKEEGTRAGVAVDMTEREVRHTGRLVRGGPLSAARAATGADAGPPGSASAPPLHEAHGKKTTVGSGPVVG